MAMPWLTGHASVTGHGDAWMDAAACAAGPGGLCMGQSLFWETRTSSQHRLLGS